MPGPILKQWRGREKDNRRRSSKRNIRRGLELKERSPNGESGEDEKSPFALGHGGLDAHEKKHGSHHCSLPIGATSEAPSTIPSRSHKLRIMNSGMVSTS
jgi:hypothetical protein